MASSTAGGSSSVKISKRIKKELHQLKVVVRQLPPDFTEEKLLEKISPLPPHVHFYFMPGDTSLGPHGLSRAYITFLNEADTLPFRDQFDGCVFESEKGVKYRSVIEYAPYQGALKRMKRQPDTRCGSIEEDAEYLSFLEEYESEPATATSVDVSTYMMELETGRVLKVQMTPLLKYLKDKRLAKLAAKGRNKLYVSDSKKKKGESSSSKSRSSKSGVKGSSEKESLKGSDVPSHKTRKEERERKKREYDSTSKPSGAYLVHKDRDITSNHLSDEQPKSRRQDRSEYGGNPDKPFSSKSIKETRSSSQDDRQHSSASKSVSYYENGEIKEDRGSSGRGGRRNKQRPDRAIYNPRDQDRDQTSRSLKPKDDECSRSKEDYGPPPRYSSDHQSKDRFIDNPRRGDRERVGERSSHDDWGGGGRRGRDRRGGKSREDYGRASNSNSGGYESRSKPSSYHDK